MKEQQQEQPKTTSSTIMLKRKLCGNKNDTSTNQYFNNHHSCMDCSRHSMVTTPSNDRRERRSLSPFGYKSNPSSTKKNRSSSTNHRRLGSFGSLTKTIGKRLFFCRDDPAPQQQHDEFYPQSSAIPPAELYSTTSTLSSGLDSHDHSHDCEQYAASLDCISPTRPSRSWGGGSGHSSTEQSKRKSHRRLITT
jgi:hypothetical protein